MSRAPARDIPESQVMVDLWEGPGAPYDPPSGEIGMRCPIRIGPGSVRFVWELSPATVTPAAGPGADEHPHQAQRSQHRERHVHRRYPADLTVLHYVSA